MQTIYRRMVVEALRRRWLGLASGLLGGYFRFTIAGGDDPLEIGAVRVEFGPGRCTLGVNPHLKGARLDYIGRRLLDSLALLSACRDTARGTIMFNLDDVAYRPGLAFCSNDPAHCLAPDPIFLHTQAYRRIADRYTAHDIAWEERLPVAFWRGTSTGIRDREDDWESIDRIRLCRITAANPAFDVGLSEIVQMNPAEAELLRALGLMRPFVPETEFIRYRYQIDIDGNSNSWPGLFIKLLTGSPVLKVASRRGFRQWYYDRLIPWENFVPVAADLSDLTERLNWLRDHDDEARRIGAAGRALARAMMPDMEIERARVAICALLASQ